MTAALVLTDRARTELADGARRGLGAVTLTRLAIGSGLNVGGRPGDTARTALRSQQDVQPVTGSTAIAGRIAYRADYIPTADYAVTEIGLFARAGQAGAEWLFGYHAVAEASSAYARTTTGLLLVLAGVVEIARSAAEITVTPSLDIRIGDPGPATTTHPGKVELATAEEARAGTDAGRALTPAAMRTLLPAGVILDYGGGRRSGRVAALRRRDVCTGAVSRALCGDRKDLRRRREPEHLRRAGSAPPRGRSARAASGRRRSRTPSGPAAARRR